MKLKNSLKWVDQWGCINTMSAAKATEVLKEFYDEWPCGLSEIESAIQSQRRIIENLSNELRLNGYSEKGIASV